MSAQCSVVYCFGPASLRVSFTNLTNVSFHKTGKEKRGKEEAGGSGCKLYVNKQTGP